MRTGRAQPSPPQGRGDVTGSDLKIKSALASLSAAVVSRWYSPSLFNNVFFSILSAKYITDEKGGALFSV